VPATNGNLIVPAASAAILYPAVRNR